MYVGKDFSPSDPGEVEVYAFDFAKDLPESETIQDSAWTCTAIEGTDGAAAGHIDGNAQVTGTVSKQRVTGLIAGVRYRLQAFVTTDQGNELSLWSHVWCQEPS